MKCVIIYSFIYLFIVIMLYISYIKIFVAVRTGSSTSSIILHLKIVYIKTILEYGTFITGQDRFIYCLS